MKPKAIYRSKKAWTALVTLAGVVLSHYLAPEMAAGIVAAGMALVVAFLRDDEKKAAAGE